MEMLPPTGWGDVATRQQIEASNVAIRQEIDHLGQMLRLELRADIADLQRRTIQWNIATVIAMASIVITIVRLG